MISFLDKILADKRKRLASAKRIRSLTEIRSAAEMHEVSPHRFRQAIGDSDPSVIAEFKRASPSRGVINTSLDPVETARSYQTGGAAAISVLTEEDHFQGSLDDLTAIRNTVDMPLLRKDFIIDEYQIFESAAVGANAMLLIVAALASESLKNFQTLAHSLGLDAIVEVHDRDEMQIAIDIGAAIIGVNNRNLKTFEVSLDVSRELILMKPDDALIIAESGISNASEIAELHSLGYDAFLVGESLMRSDDPVAELRRLHDQG
jgi:indole-3-glycerol phosphate synthase